MESLSEILRTSQAAYEAETQKTLETAMGQMGIVHLPNGNWITQDGRIFTTEQLMAGAAYQGGAGGASGPSAEELAIEREKLALEDRRQKMSAIVSEMESGITLHGISANQAIEQFKSRVAAMNQAQQTIADLAPYAVAPGTQYVPGGEPGGLYQEGAKGFGIDMGPLPLATRNVDPYEAYKESKQYQAPQFDFESFKNDELRKLLGG